MPWPEPTAELAAASLATLGVRVDAAAIHVEPREQRWLVRLPERRVAWFAASEAGRRVLATERRVLALLEARCSFAVPRVIAVHASGDFDVRAMVPGSAEPFAVFAAVRADDQLAARMGARIGAMLAEQHTRITAADVAAWLPRQPGWPLARAWVLERIARVVDDVGLLADADAVMRAYEIRVVAEADCVLVHGDVGFHNLGIDPTTFEVHGIFDYEDAVWADRHFDFRYLVFDEDRDALLEAAIAAYEPAVGAKIDRARVRLHNAACALTFLAYREGTPPEAPSCGRTLAQDLRWSRHAIARAMG